MFQQIRAERGERGFTLVELLVVIAILGILAGVVVFSLSSVGDNGAAAACKTEKSIALTSLALALNQSPSGSTTAVIDAKAASFITGTPTYYKVSGGAVTAVGTPPC